jgi:hypothetical protein
MEAVDANGDGMVDVAGDENPPAAVAVSVSISMGAHRLASPRQHPYLINYQAIN